MNLRKFFVFPFVITSVIAGGGPVHDAAQSQEPRTVLITGANRGLGLEFARHFDALGYSVIGTARNPGRAVELKELGVRVEQLDVTDEASVSALVDRLDGVNIDVLINNAGYFNRTHHTLAEVDWDDLAHTFAVNAMGPLRVTRALLPNLQSGEGKTVVNISSQMGSVGTNGGGYYSYRASKAALNQLTVTLAQELEDQGFCCVVMHPGWVRTRMGGENATYSPEESVGGMVEVIKGLTAADTGRFLDLHGQEIPW
jgi:NAD(P)-dependent dehydrogenase (short-subunit alcohol dehydrogenase family)